MTGALALLGGVLAGLASTRLPHAAWMWCAGIGVAGTLLTPLRALSVARRLALLLGGLWLGWLSVGCWQASLLRPPAPDSRVLLEGEISSVPARDGAELGFDAEVHILAGPGAGDAPRRARLRWRDAATAPRVGERWRLLARLGHAGDTHNFHGVDAQRMAFRDRIHFSARVLPSALNSRLALASNSIDTLRARISARIRERIADPDAAGLIAALAVGLTDGMSTDQWRVFNATGTTHLVAISGLHVTLFAMLAFGGARLLWRCMPTGRVLEREPFALLLGLAAAGGYSLLAGFSVPTQRTWLMLAVFAWARLCARPLDAARTWSLALVAVLLLDPLAPLAAGFWLSFVAVGVILLLEGSSLVRPPRAARALELQFAVMLTLAPLTFAVFGGVSLVGFGVNLLAIPLISFVFVPLLLTGALLAWWFPALDGLPFGAAAALYEWLWPALVRAADLESASWRVAPSAWWFMLAIPAALASLWRWPLALRLSGAAMLLPLVFMPSRLPESGAVRVDVLDAGRGSAVLIATHAHVLLYDTGDSWSSHGTNLARVVLPALDALGLRRVDLLVLPRLDRDRAAGAALLAAERGVERILVGGGWPGTALPAGVCRDGRFEWEGVVVESFAAGRHRDHCVLRVSTGSHALLLAGDLDAAAERELLARLPPGALASEVVLMSRQAGAAGSSAEWIEASGAGLAIATGGIDTSDARARTIARWRGSGARVLDTRAHGGIQFVFGTRGMGTLSTARSARHPFAWRRFD
jgi:competence protein ComEC